MISIYVWKNIPAHYSHGDEITISVGEENRLLSEDSNTVVYHYDDATMVCEKIKGSQYRILDIQTHGGN